MKRPAEDSSYSHSTNGQYDGSPPSKKARKHHHRINHRQAAAVQSLQGAQDEVFFQSQLLRSIVLSLSAQGFDAVDSTALEAFRLATETYMLRFLKSVTSSMQGSRREAPTPEDFAIALARSNLQSSDLSPFLLIPPLPSICQPAIPRIHDTDKAGDNKTDSLDTILRLASDEIPRRQKHVPKHFPGLPSRHTWKATAVFRSREEDARILREQATKEGIMAEQALRRLTEAQKVLDQSDSTKRTRQVRQRRSERSWERALVMIDDKDDEELHTATRCERELSSPVLSAIEAAAKNLASNETFESAAVVNSGRLRWREFARGKS